MYIHRSNRSELLVDALAEVIDKPLASWTEPETIVVQGRGMERWLAMRLAERQGVYATLDSRSLARFSTKPSDESNRRDRQLKSPCLSSTG